MQVLNNKFLETNIEPAVIEKHNNPSEPLPSIKYDCKIACILDEFSYECFKYESNFIQLEPDNWEEVVNKDKPDLLFVESAWKGKNKKWQHKISAWKKSRNEILCSLLAWCRENQIPTVFWNKEDPANHKFFIDSAKLFDYVFTSDANSIDKYKEVMDHDRIYVLPFAAQPKLHNPINRDKEKWGKVAFAGTWYNQKYENRRKNLDILLSPCLDYDLHIYDRMGHTPHINYLFPDKYKPCIKGSLEYSEMLEAYKKYDVFLNVNSVEDSPTMFSRRVFEVLGCGTSIISNYSPAIESFFPGIVKLCSAERKVRQNLQVMLGNSEYRERLGMRGMREVLNKHTYRHRLETIFEYVGLPFAKEKPGRVSIIAVVKNLEEINNVINNYLQQTYSYKNLILIIKNRRLKPKNIGKYFKPEDNIKIYKIKPKHSRGKGLNYGIQNTDAKYITVYNPLDYYAPEFLTDLMNAFKYADADIIGKTSYYEYDSKSKSEVIKRPNLENRYAEILCGSAMVIKKEVFDQVQFGEARSSDESGFLINCLLKGVKLYSADRFNFIKNASVRGMCENRRYVQV